LEFEAILNSPHVGGRALGRSHQWVVASMADRIRLSLGTGQRTTHRMPWADPESNSKVSRKGSLDWSVVVLEELTVDLEVSVQLCPASEEATPGLVLLQETARGRTFRGTFNPASDKRLRPAANVGGGGSTSSKDGETTEGSESSSPPEVDAVIFEFSNAFSWWTPKEVELVIVRHRPGQPESEVSPLPILPPLSAVPRSTSSSGGAAEDVGPVPLAVLQPAPVDEAMKTLGAGEHSAQRLAAVLQKWLSSVEEIPVDSDKEGEWLEELRKRCASLQGFCLEGPESLGELEAGEDGNAPQRHVVPNGEEATMPVDTGTNTIDDSGPCGRTGESLPEGTGSTQEDTP